MKNVPWHPLAGLLRQQDPAVLLVRAKKVEAVPVQDQVPVVGPVLREEVIELGACLSIDDLSTNLQIFI